MKFAVFGFLASASVALAQIVSDPPRQRPAMQPFLSNPPAATPTPVQVTVSSTQQTANTTGTTVGTVTEVKPVKVWRIRQVSGQGFSDSQSGHHGVLGANSVFVSIKGEITGDKVTVSSTSTAKGFGSDTVNATKSIRLRATSDGHIEADQTEASADERKAGVESKVSISTVDPDGKGKRLVVTFSAASAFKMGIVKTSRGLTLSESLNNDGVGLAKTSYAVFEAVRE